MPEIEYYECTTCNNKNIKINQKVSKKQFNDNEDSICRCFFESDKYAPWMFEIHGLSQALLSKTLRRRAIFWIILFGCASLCIAMTTLVILEYLNMQTATSTTIKIVPSLELPGITICPKVADALNFTGIYDNLKINFPNITIQESKDLILYFLAGHGFENMDDITTFNRSYLEYIGDKYTYWSRNYSTELFFYHIQDLYGLKCKDFLIKCDFNGVDMDCCNEIFRSMVVMRRGLCFQSKPGLKQKEVDDLGKLTVRINSPPSVTNTNYSYQKQIIVLVNDNFNYVASAQRFYINPNTFNRLYISARKIELLNHKNDCSNKIVGVDAGCLVKEWLQKNIFGLQNCTLTYLKHIPGTEGLPICNVSTIVNFYFLTIQYIRSGSTNITKCLPGCHRWEYTTSLQQGNSLKDFEGYNFSIDFTYNSLQYQEITEVYTTTIPGFMSQIGGQFGFCLGFSILTILQINVSLKCDGPRPHTKCSHCSNLWKSELHGLGFLISLKPGIGRYIWFIILLIGISAAIYLTSLVVEEYFSKKTTTLVKIQRNNKLLYPYITLCPKNADTFNVTAIRKDIWSFKPALPKKTVDNLIMYALAGGGIDNYGPLISNFNSGDMIELEGLMNSWIKQKGSISNVYKFILEDMNFNCTEFFKNCYYGGNDIDCCSIFKSTFVLLRGKCFTLNNFYQRDPDEIGKIGLVIKSLPSAFISNQTYQLQLVVYNSNPGSDIRLFPRFYLNVLDWNRFRFTQQQYDLLAGDSQCNNDPNYKGRGSCFITQWLNEKIINKYKCTFWYMSYRSPNMTICHPSIIIKNYNDIMPLDIQSIPCLQSCKRHETTVELISRPYNFKLAGFGKDTLPLFRIEMSHTLLQTELYKEIITTTVPGFISQIGGHSGLFLGFTIITILQFLIVILKTIKNMYEKLKNDDLRFILW
ncbi:Na+ channel, amiloride-sensitive family-containing protein [Strongyloides ratti]|uniref:Na+ channel, amiloride-sensitive family-containing protein n=1 Tax=Strongyloides ratti TaxID=34506 RepID=A0A090N0X6_STRRB|nr:Na+ channel, amiloride-sensitive family-containing protein [Strongyloides ratti]CEF71453.1 Na+ channel, amiloride-sensitive family-containing protein [Strongyloides ratti]